MRPEGIKMKVHVFQFNLTDMEREELEHLGWEATDRISQWGEKRLLQIACFRSLATRQWQSSPPRTSMSTNWS